jgi:hypothetical protein
MLWAVLIVIILLILFSIYGAFLGSERAQNFFSSPVLIVYWFVLALMLLAGIIIFRRLLLIHFGCIIIILGAMLGSDAGHRFQRKFLGIDKIHRGWMLLYQGWESNKVKLEKDRQIKELPFSIRLKELKLSVIENNRTIVEKNVEVNHPLHYGGYYFYQHSYDTQNGQYSVLMVASDSGLTLTYAGYAALCVGVIRQSWLRNMFRKKDVPD